MMAIYYCAKTRGPLAKSCTVLTLFSELTSAVSKVKIGLAIQSNLYFAVSAKFLQHHNIIVANAISALLSATAKKYLLTPNAISALLSATAKKYLLTPNAISALLSATAKKYLLTPNAISALLSATAKKALLSA